MQQKQGRQGGMGKRKRMQENQLGASTSGRHECDGSARASRRKARTKSRKRKLNQRQGRQVREVWSDARAASQHSWHLHNVVIYPN